VAGDLTGADLQVSWMIWNLSFHFVSDKRSKACTLTAETALNLAAELNHLDRI